MASHVGGSHDRGPERQLQASLLSPSTVLPVAPLGYAGMRTEKVNTLLVVYDHKGRVGGEVNGATNDACVTFP
jgi:hypothetical protein